MCVCVRVFTENKKNCHMDMMSCFEMRWTQHERNRDTKKMKWKRIAMNEKLTKSTRTDMTEIIKPCHFFHFSHHLFYFVRIDNVQFQNLAYDWLYRICSFANFTDCTLFHQFYTSVETQTSTCHLPIFVIPSSVRFDVTTGTIFSLQSKTSWHSSWNNHLKTKQ